MRTILHVDLNNFYASVECRRRPELADRPVIVCGSREERHGIVLAKNQIAKSYGIVTGEVIWQAKRKCPQLVEVPADFPAYVQASVRVRSIYERYTDRIEPFGIDECWLDVTNSRALFGDGLDIAERIRKEVKAETGLTVSVGVSFNKVFAKFASDLKKPDAVTEISLDRFREMLWDRPASELLYVGKKTARRLEELGIVTVGDLARADVRGLEKILGKNGTLLWRFANGRDDSPVRPVQEAESAKSVGNSLTASHDLVNAEEADVLLRLLADSVAARLREAGLGKAQTLRLWIRDRDLESIVRQGRLPYPSCTGKTYAEFALQLLKSHYSFSKPIRALGISVSDFTSGDEQLRLFPEEQGESRIERLERTVDGIRKKYGHSAIDRAVIRNDPAFSSYHIKEEHLVHPEPFLKKSDS